MKFTLKNYRQSPQKVALIGNIIRGKGVKEALTMLEYMNQKASIAIAKLIQSGVHAMEQQGKKTDSLAIKQLLVDKGITYHRIRPRAKGKTAPIQKRCSHITIELA